MPDNREIKFRVWDKVLQCWSKNTFSFSMSKEGIITPDLGDRYIIVQYIGLKDKTGQEIYQGDIYRYGRFALNDFAKYGREPWNNMPVGVDENDITTEHKRFVVEWDYRKLLALQRQIEESPDVDGVEVIGNIYQNPELLEALNDS